MRPRILPALALIAGLCSPAAGSPPDIAPLAAERPGTLTVPMPCRTVECGARSDDPDSYAIGMRTVYLEFNSITLTASNTTDDARSNKSSILSRALSPGQSTTLGGFNHFDLSFTNGFSRDQIIAGTVAELNSIFEPYNVEFTTTRPASGDYHMIVFSGSCVGVAGQTGCAGIAPLDCGDLFNNNIVYVFPGNLRPGDLAATAAQELAHAFGLSHTNDNQDVMYPTIQGGVIPDHFGAGAIPDPPQEVCGAATYQDSHEKLLSIVGYRGQDGTAPRVDIVTPGQGDFVLPGSRVEATIEENNTIVSATLLLNSVEIETLTAPPWTFSIPDEVEPGETYIKVKAVDDSDNEGETRVVVNMGTGAETPCENGACADGFECVAQICVPDDSGILGSTCAGDDDCVSEMCAESGGEKRCSQSCNAEMPCPSNFECIADTACWPLEPTEKDEEGGCSVVGDPRDAMAALGLIALALMAGLRRRRLLR